MLSLVTYDISDLHTQVKSAAKSVGFRDFIVANAGNSVPLPNTTLLVDAVDPSEALDKFKFVVRSVSPSIVIQRAAAFDWSSAAMHTDLQKLDALIAALEARPLPPLGGFFR